MQGREGARAGGSAVALLGDGGLGSFEEGAQLVGVLCGGQKILAGGGDTVGRGALINCETGEEHELAPGKM